MKAFITAIRMQQTKSVVKHSVLEGL